MASSRYPAYDEPPAAAAGPPPGGVTNELVDPETLYTKQGQIGGYSQGTGCREAGCADALW